MTEQTDRIDTDVLIAAPPERVWELVTRGEHVGRWFGDAAAEIELRPGGALKITWAEYGTVHGRVEAVEPPRRFAYRWLVSFETPEAATPANSTLVEFTLAAEGEGTRVAVAESGFDGLELASEARTERFADHTTGWVKELDELVAYAQGAAAGR